MPEYKSKKARYKPQQLHAFSETGRHNPEKNTPSEFKEIQGTLERITFQSDQTGFTVARLKKAGESGEIITIVGFLGGVAAGSTLILNGLWEQDSRHGPQFKVHHYTLLKPDTLNGMERYLGSGLIKGIGPKFAERIVKRFGIATLEVLEKEPDRLLEVPGLGRKRFEGIKKAWIDQKQIHEIMVFLQGHGISATFAVKIFKTYGAKSVDIVNKNPYRLAEDIWGIGFKVADRIAQSIGISTHDPRRARAGLLFVLHEGIGDGHCFLSFSRLIKMSHKLLGLSQKLLEPQIPLLAKDEKIIIEEDCIYPTRLYGAETGAAANLMAIYETATAELKGDIDAAIAKAGKVMKFGLADEQLDAVRTALRHKVAIITGGPGTGKSTILRAVMLVMESQDRIIKLAAPTGRAAKRLSEATGREAKTIHRLLEFDPTLFDFRHNEENPLEADLVVVDEASMMDIFLAQALFRAIPPAASLLLVGDVDQLPSVGPGNVLRDIIDSQRVEVVRLSHIFRQSRGSLISVNASRINEGKFLELLNNYKGDKDFYFISRETAEEIEKEIISLCSGRLAKKYKFDPFRDIQVLTPMRKGDVGVDNLNRRLQDTLNPAEPALAKGGRQFRIGDKVMQVRNNYDKDVFNGDLGHVVGCNKDNESLELHFDGKTVSYEMSELDELELAYAVTIHKSQGSEFPCVILPLHTTHYPLLQRNLLYTGVTRGKKLVIVVGSQKALSAAIRNNRAMVRNTKLKERLAAW